MKRDEIMKEIWKNVPVKPFNQNYQVSNLGRIRSKNHIVIQKRPRGLILPILHKGKILKPYRQIKRGWKLAREEVVLCANGKQKTYLVHRLVAKAFVPNPYHYLLINHKDEDEKNNRASNLEWCTSKYNNNYGNIKKRISLSKRNPCALIKNNIEYTFLSVRDAAIYLHINLHCSKSQHAAEMNVASACNPKTKWHKTIYGFRAKYLKEADPC